MKNLKQFLELGIRPQRVIIYTRIFDIYMYLSHHGLHILIVDYENNREVSYKMFMNETIYNKDNLGKIQDVSRHTEDEICKYLGIKMKERL